jgi:hypothetical protein
VAFKGEFGLEIGCLSGYLRELAGPTPNYRKAVVIEKIK